MGKYYLVGYYYNKDKNKKENETYYKEFSSEINIDKYTSLYDKYTLLEEIQKTKPNSKLNSLEIRYFEKKNDENWHSIPIITDNIEFYKTANNIINNKKTNNKTYIQYLDPNLYEERYRFITLLLKKNEELINLIYPENNYDNSFSNLINNYLKYPTNDKLDIINKEFSKYTNYRRWITTKERLKYKYKEVKDVLSITKDQIYNLGFNREDLEKNFPIYQEFSENKMMKR